MTRKLALGLSDSVIDRNVMKETWRRKAKQGERAIMDEARRLQRTRSEIGNTGVRASARHTTL